MFDPGCTSSRPWPNRVNNWYCGRNFDWSRWKTSLEILPSMSQSQIRWCSAIIVQRLGTALLHEEGYQSSKSLVICRSELHKHSWITIKCHQNRGKHQNLSNFPVLWFIWSRIWMTGRNLGRGHFGRKMASGQWLQVFIGYQLQKWVIPVMGRHIQSEAKRLGH